MSSFFFSFFSSTKSENRRVKHVLPRWRLIPMGRGRLQEKEVRR
jgi:hypothetical protein